MEQRHVNSIVVPGSPIYLLALGPFALFAIPLVTIAFGRSVWPGLSRSRLAVLGCLTTLSFLVIFATTVFWFYGLGAPTGTWAWLGPLAALLVYVAGATWQACGHPSRWPFVATASMPTIGAVGATAAALGVPFQS